MKIDNEKFIEVGKIVEHYGKYVILKLPHIHPATGCDTTSYLHVVGKIKVFEKWGNSKEELILLQDIGVLSTINKKAVDKVSKFIQTMCYSGMEDESVTETRVRIYELLKMKNSQSIPSDKNSMLQAIKRVNCQSYHWLRSDITVISETDLSENDWMIIVYYVYVLFKQNMFLKLSEFEWID